MLSYVPIAATFFLIAASVSPIRCQNQVNGPTKRMSDVTAIENHPHHVSLHLYDSFKCSGSIISEFHVLTAAHCLRNISASQLTIRAGSTYFNKGGTVYNVRSIEIHENFDYNTAVHNIGLVRVTNGFVYDKYKQPIQMSQTCEEPKANEVAVITGWGKNEHGFTNILQNVYVFIIDRNTCNNVYKCQGGLPIGQFCAGLGKGICDGDSGGPLVIKGRQAGILSWTRECASSKYPDVYTDVAYHYEWIEKKIKQSC